MRALSLLLLAAVCAADDHPLAKDKTGIRWVYPFKNAHARALANKRLILMLPLAGGSNAAGNW